MDNSSDEITAKDENGNWYILIDKHKITFHCTPNESRTGFNCSWVINTRDLEGGGFSEGFGNAFSLTETGAQGAAILEAKDAIDKYYKENPAERR